MSNQTKDKLLKTLIEESGYTQKSLAQALGLAYSTVKYYVSGEVRPSVDVIAAMCRVLKRSPKEVMTALGIDVSSIPDDGAIEQNN